MKERISCQLTDLVWRLLPLSVLRSRLLNLHLNKCPYCQKKLVDQDEARSLFPEPEDIKLLPRMMEKAFALEAEIESKSGLLENRRKPSLLTGVYAGLTATAIIVLLIGFGLYFIRSGQQPVSVSYNETIKTDLVSEVSLIYVRTKGQPASSFIYKTHDPDMIIIWIEGKD
jgi:hypothetical protein